MDVAQWRNQLFGPSETLNLFGPLETWAVFWNVYVFWTEFSFRMVVALEAAGRPVGLEHFPGSLISGKRRV